MVSTLIGIGALVVFAAIIGGGFEGWNIKIPKIQGFKRIGVGVFGFCLICSGFCVYLVPRPADESPDEAGVTPTPERPQQVTTHSYPEKVDQAVESIHENPEASLTTEELGRAVFLQILDKIVDQAVESIHENPEASLIKEEMNRALSLQILGKTDEAVEKWRAVAHASEGSDDDQAARAWFSVGYVRHEQDPKESLSAYGQAIRLKPNFAKAYTGRGITKDLLGLHEDALADFDHAIRLKPDVAQTYYIRGVLKDELGRHKEALADFDQAIRLKPDYARAYYNRGITTGQLGDNDKARAEFETALALARTAGNTKLEAQVELFLRTLKLFPGMRIMGDPGTEELVSSE